MAILAFQKPDKVLMLEADNFFGKFEFRHLKVLLLHPLRSTGLTMNLVQSRVLSRM